MNNATETVEAQAPAGPRPFASGLHPSWCDPGRCEAAESGGDHRSAPRRVESPCTGYPVIDVFLWADCCQPVSEAERDPAIELQLAVSDGDRGESVATFELTPGQLRALGALAPEVANRADSRQACLAVTA